eukprot:357260-Chlamydomonas_euryale.AAC.1
MSGGMLPAINCRRGGAGNTTSGLGPAPDVEPAATAGNTGGGGGRNSGSLAAAHPQQPSCAAGTRTGGPGAEPSLRAHSRGDDLLGKLRSMGGGGRATPGGDLNGGGAGLTSTAGRDGRSSPSVASMFGRALPIPCGFDVGTGPTGSGDGPPQRLSFAEGTSGMSGKSSPGSPISPGRPGGGGSPGSGGVRMRERFSLSGALAGTEVGNPLTLGSKSRLNPGALAGLGGGGLGGGGMGSGQPGGNGLGGGRPGGSGLGSGGAQHHTPEPALHGLLDSAAVASDTGAAQAVQSGHQL